MGAIEEGGKVATSVVESMKAQPLALAVIVVNVLFLAFLVYVFHAISTTNRIERERRAEMFQELRKTCETCRARLDPQYRLQSDDPTGTGHQ